MIIALPFDNIFDSIVKLILDGAGVVNDVHKIMPISKMHGINTVDANVL